METVQNLRQKAYEAGNLRSTEQANVVQQGPAYVIEPASPQVVYVPYYDPRVAYGSWWWPAYPPVYWTPWPGYAYPGYVVGFAWGAGITVGARFFFSSCDWRARHVTIVNVTNVFVNRPGAVIRSVPVRTGQPVIWQHDPAHRRGVPYHIASVEQRFGRSAFADQRRDFRWQSPLAATTRNGSLNRPEVHVDHIRSNPRRGDGGRAGRTDGFYGGSARPDFRAPVTPRPPAAAAPQAQPRGFANQRQAGNHPGQAAGKAHDEGRGR